MDIGLFIRKIGNIFYQPKPEVSEEAKSVFELCGFEDKNNNGVIEKASWENLWKNEGYDRSADINKDGKITAAEAKFYLWWLEDIGQQRHQFAFTDPEKNEVVTLLRTKLESVQKNSFDRDAMVADISKFISEIGLYNLAYIEARSISEPKDRERVMKEIKLAKTNNDERIRTEHAGPIVLASARVKKPNVTPAIKDVLKTPAIPFELARHFQKPHQKEKDLFPIKTYRLVLHNPEHTEIISFSQND